MLADAQREQDLPVDVGLVGGNDRAIRELLGEQPGGRVLVEASAPGYLVEDAPRVVGAEVFF